MYVEVKSLSAAIQSALEAVHYGARDIKVEPVTEVSSYSEGGAGQRGFVTVINLDTGKREGRMGSWGGGNMFTHSPVDAGDERIPIPPNGAVLKGHTGYPRTWAVLYAHPDAIGRFLPAPDTDTLTDEDQQAIYCFAAIKGGQYRRDELRRRKVSEATVDSLVERGYLKRSKNGATQITTKGKNARTPGLMG